MGLEQLAWSSSQNSISNNRMVEKRSTSSDFATSTC